MNLDNICQKEGEVEKDMSSMGYTKLGQYENIIVYGRENTRIPYVKIKEGIYMMGMSYEGKKYITPTVSLVDCVDALTKMYGGIKND